MSAKNEKRIVPFPSEGIQDEEVERVLMGSILISPDLLVQVSNFVEPDDFYYLRHQLLYTALLDMHEQGQPIERLHIIEWFKRQPDKLKAVGGTDSLNLYVSEIKNTVPSAMYGLQYAGIVRYYSRRRLIVERAHEIAERVGNNTLGHDEALSLLEQTARDAQLPSSAQDDLVSILDAVGIQMREMDSPEVDAITRFHSGLDQLDDLLGSGFRKNNIYMHGGRPGMGKTSAILKFAMEAALHMHESKSNEIVVVITLEMSVREMTNRVLSSLSGIPYIKLDTREELTADEYIKLYRAVALLGDIEDRYYFWNPSSVTPEEIWRKLQAVQVEMGRNVGAVFVDHIHIMSAPDKHNKDERSKYNYIIDMFRHMRDHRDEASQKYTVDAVWHLVGQLSRKCEERKDKRPILSDFRETGKIEEHANAILMYYRDSVYYEEFADDKTMEIIIRKNRGGPTGTAKAVFFGETYALENPAVHVDEDDAPPPPKNIDLTLL